MPFGREHPGIEERSPNSICPSLTRRVLGECLSLRKKKTVPWMPPPVPLLPPISLVLPMPQRHKLYQRQHQRRKFAGWKKIIHPSQPVLAAGDIPQSTPMPKVKGVARELVQTISINPPLCITKVPSPPPSPLSTRALMLRWPLTPPQGFAGVTACLKTPEVVEVGREMPVGTMSIGLVTTPGISSVSSSRMIKDDTTGLVYVDTVTTSLGRVVLGRPDQIEGPIIEDITDQS